MKPKDVLAIEALLRDAYGTRAGHAAEPNSVEELFRGYYGGSPRKPVVRPGPKVSLSSSFDDGEVLRGRPRSSRTSVESSLWSAIHRARALADETLSVDVSPAREAEVDLGPTALRTATGVPAGSENGPSLAPGTAPVVQPRAASGQVTCSPSPALNLPGPSAAAGPSSSPGMAAAPGGHVARGAPTTPGPSVGPLAPGIAGAAPPGGIGGAAPGSADDGFAADLEAILKGEKVYDPTTKRTVDKGDLSEKRAAPPPPPPPVPAGDGQTIFERIAQSMQYANAYDLGTVELRDRFAAFDREVDQKKRTTSANVAPAQGPAAGIFQAKVAPRRDATPSSSSQAFMQDLDAIDRRTRGPAVRAGVQAGEAQCAAPPLQNLSAMQQLSRALYDTGEHVLAAESTFADRLRVGSGGQVTFSYGQIIAMADMFGSVDDMMRASAGELSAIKQLIERSTNHYKGGGDANPSTTDWQRTTSLRYLSLAEDNYDHFAPNMLFQQASFAARVRPNRNHRVTWEEHHERALREAQALALHGMNTGTTTFPEWPFIINAFGDHFLTDAFAAGHVINKEAIIGLYQSQFYSGGKLTSAGRGFLARVAKLAFKGEVARRFSVLETYEPYDAWWNFFNWNPNIDSADRFAEVLIGVAEQVPEKMGNLAVKAIHDKLNKEGIAVTNDAGSAPWPLTGDGHLSPATLVVMRQAVQQSIDNVEDPALLSSNTNYGPLMDRVWRFVPRLTPASEQRVTSMAHTLVSPSSEELVNKAAIIINEEVKTLICELLARNALKPA